MDPTAVDRWLAAFEARIGRYADHAPAVFRVGLGAVILLGGLHKLVAPGAWAVYMAPAFARVWPVGLDATMVAFGLSEVPFGLLLLADRYVAFAAAVVAVSMLGVFVNFGVGLVQTGEFADVLVRDLAVFVLAVGVAIRATDAADDR